MNSENHSEKEVGCRLNRVAGEECLPGLCLGWK